MEVLITGHSRGLGAALADAYLAGGHTVYGIARGRLAREHPGLVQAQADFAAAESVPAALDGLVPAGAALDVVFLNAGVLGPIEAMRRTSLVTLREVMEVNVWANKTALDWLAARDPAPRQVLLMSSGAAVNGNYGWGAYALSKAALNMLTQLYAQEMPHSHLVAFAPGLVDTAMQDFLRTRSAEEFPSLQRIHAAHGTPAMPPPALAAQRILGVVPRLPADHPSGSFVDVRTAYPE